MYCRQCRAGRVYDVGAGNAWREGRVNDVGAVRQCRARKYTVTAMLAHLRLEM